MTGSCERHGLPAVDRVCGDFRCRTCLDEYEELHARDVPPKPRPPAVLPEPHGGRYVLGPDGRYMFVPS